MTLHSPSASTDSASETRDALALAKRLIHIAQALSAEQETELLLERILEEARSITRADGGTLYYRTEDDMLDFAIVRTESLNMAYGGSAKKIPVLEPIALYNEETGEPNYTVQAVYAVLKKKPINIADVYDADGFDFAGTKQFDITFNYRTQSVITIPMVNHKGDVLGCLQLVNAQDEHGNTIPFSKETQEITQALASQAAIILDNRQLIDAQENLLESFIKVLAKAIDNKSPYTGGHCERVPVLLEMIAEAGCKSNEGIFKDFNLNETEWHELHVAGWLHDCGKVSTPVHVMDKATKLETICDRIDTIRARYETLKRDAFIHHLQAKADTAAYSKEIEMLEEELKFVEEANIGGEFMDDNKLERLQQIASKTWVCQGKEEPLLSANELYNLSIRRGTITTEERTIMESHMNHTADMLEALPFPKHLKRVPEYALGHHERMDGKGYPRGIPAGEMSIPARMMAVADVFEALTAADRPYKPAKKLSEAMRIIGMMKKTNHLDPDMVDLFVQSKVYLDYAKKYLNASLIDDIDEDSILAIQPEPMRK